MRHNGILVALSIVLQLPLALGVALLLNRPMRGASLIRLVFFAPYVLSEAITAIVFLQILQPARARRRGAARRSGSAASSSSGSPTSGSSSTRSSS